MANSNQQNGSAAAPIDLANQTVVGINFGNSYASISVLNKVCNFDVETTNVCADIVVGSKEIRNALPMRMENVRLLVLSVSMARKWCVLLSSIFSQR